MHGVLEGNFMQDAAVAEDDSIVMAVVTKSGGISHGKWGFYARNETG